MPRKRTQPKQITNLAEAWRYLAEKLDKQRRANPTWDFWLCCILTDGGYAGVNVDRIDSDVRLHMERRIEIDLLQESGAGASYGQGIEANEARVLVCLMFALEAEDAETKWSAA